jgi:hypothetical protein
MGTLQEYHRVSVTLHGHPARRGSDLKANQARVVQAFLEHFK